MCEKKTKHRSQIVALSANQNLVNKTILFYKKFSVLLVSVTVFQHVKLFIETNLLSILPEFGMYGKNPQ
jgi:hypothetical protein